MNRSIAAKLAARKQQITRTTLPQQTEETHAAASVATTPSATVTATSTATASKLSSTKKQQSLVSASKPTPNKQLHTPLQKSNNNSQSAAKLKQSTRQHSQQPPTPASSPSVVAAAASTSDEEEEKEDEESEDESSDDDSSSASSSSSYVSSEEEIDEEGRKSFRIFLCPIPSTCADAHPKTNTTSAASLTSIDPYTVPPTTPSPCHTSITATFTRALTTRFSEFGLVEDIEIHSKPGIPCTDEERGVKKIPKGMAACRECLNCPQCRLHQQRHFAYVTIRTTQERVTTLLSAFNRAKWRGEYIRVEVAKPDFELRYSKERQLMKKKKLQEKLKEVKKVEAATDLCQKQVDVPLGTKEYQLKDQFGYLVKMKEQVPQKELIENTDTEVKPLPLSQLDWSEQPAPDPSSIPRAPIDYELLAAVFAGLSSSEVGSFGLQQQKKKKRKFKNEDEEWGALERGEDEVRINQRKESDNENDAADDENELPSSNPLDEAENSEDEWAMLETGKKPEPKIVAKPTATKKTPAPQPDEVRSDADDDDAGMMRTDAVDEDDLDAEFAALEREEAPVPPVAVMQSAKAKLDTKATKQPVTASKPSPKLAATATTKSSPKLTPATAAKVTTTPVPVTAKQTKPTPAAVPAAKVSAANWLGSDDENDDGDGDDNENTTNDNDINGGDNDELTLRKAFHGPNASNLIQLERSYGGDSRFKLDARFEEKEGDDEMRNGEKDDGEEHQDGSVKKKAKRSSVKESETDDIDSQTASAPSTAAAAAGGLHPSLAALSSSEFMKQHLLAEKRRALSILEEVAARPGYTTLSLDEVSEGVIPEHSGISNKSLKSLQIEAKISARGQRKPDAHYTKSEFKDTMEFISDDFDSEMIEKLKRDAAASSASVVDADGDVAMRAAAISVSLQKWMPVLNEDGTVSTSTNSSENIAQRIQIEAEDEEIERRKKKRFWKDVTRFDPNAEQQVAEEEKSTTNESSTSAAAAAVEKSSASSSSGVAKPKLNPAVLAKYTPQATFASIERDSDMPLYEIGSQRLRSLFAAPSSVNEVTAAPAATSTVSFSIDSMKKPQQLEKVTGVVSFKFGFGGGGGGGGGGDDDSTNDSKQPLDMRSLFAPSSSSTSLAVAPSSPAAAPASPTVAPVPSSRTPAAKSKPPTFSNPMLNSTPTSSSSSSSSAIPSRVLVTDMRTSLPLAAAPKPTTVLRASAFVQSRMSAAPSSAAAAMRKGATSTADSDSDDDDDANNADAFMRSSSTNDDSLTSAWLNARASATQNFRSANKSAVRKSGGRKEYVSDGAGVPLKRNVEDLAMDVLEASEGSAKRRKR